MDRTYTTSGTTKIFIACAHKDLAIVKKLENYLQEPNTSIYIHEIEQKKPNGERLSQADIVLLMISPDFLNSDYCYGSEVAQVIARQEQETVQVFPILLRPIYWGKTPFAHLQALPLDGQPITLHDVPSRTLQGVAQTIRNLARSSGEEHHYSQPPYSLTGKITSPSSQLQSQRLLRIFIGITTILLVVVIAFGFTIVRLLTTPPQSSSQPVVSATPTPTPVATLPCVVNVGTWIGGSADWKSFNGMLLNDGTNTNFNRDNGPTIVAPCQLGNTTNYAVETKIQMTNGHGCFGITVRGSSGPSHWQGYMAGAGDCSYSWGNAYIGGPGYNSDSSSVKGSFDPSTNGHTYRVEVNGNTIKFFIDGNPLLSLTDNRYLTGSLVGLWSEGVQLQVTSFEVISL